MAITHTNKSFWKIFIISFVSVFDFVTTQQPILLQSPTYGGSGPYFYNSSSFHSLRPDYNGEHGHHLHPGPGHPLSQLTESQGQDAPPFGGSGGFPPSRFPLGENYGVPHSPPLRPSGLDYEPGSGKTEHGESSFSKSKTVSGDYCWDPLFSCDTPRTILYCILNRCTCPTDWTLAPGNLPLNTVWDPSSKRCLSILGSGCHVFPTAIGNGYVYCQPGVQCVPHPNWKEMGTCGTARLTINGISLLVLAMISRVLFTVAFNS